MEKVPESDEANNCIASGTTVLVSRPDLVDLFVSNPPQGPLIQGNSFAVTDTVKNQGNVAAIASTARYYLSADKAKGGGDILLTGSRAVPALQAGGPPSTGKATVKIPAGAAAGTYYLLACADDTGLAAETDENNNCTASGSQVVVSRPDLVDLFVSNPPSGPLTQGNSFAVIDMVQNQGNVAAGASTTRYYLSTNSVKEGGDILLTGSRAVPALPAGATSTGKATVKIPAGAAAGTYYLLACPDDTGLVPETDEANNCMASDSTVEVFP
jgi:subtilase family serine protease